MVKIVQYYVYVIDLDKSILIKEETFRDANPQYEEGKPCVYVGQSYLKPRERFQKHKDGYKAGRKFVTKYGRWVKKKRIPDKNPHLTRPASEKREKKVAEILKKRGWAVWTN